MKFDRFNLSILIGALVVAMGWLSSAAFAKETTLQQGQSRDNYVSATELVKGIGTSPRPPRGR